jgi:hypothetical protein
MFSQHVASSVFSLTLKTEAVLSIEMSVNLKPDYTSVNAVLKRALFINSTASRPALGLTATSIQWVLRDVFPGVKWPGRRADHSPPSSAEVELYLRYPIRLHGVVFN